MLQKSETPSLLLQRTKKVGWTVICLRNGFVNRMRNLNSKTENLTDSRQLPCPSSNWWFKSDQDVFSPPNATSIAQPMGQGVIWSLKDDLLNQTVPE